MNLALTKVENVQEIKVVTANATYGVGLITSIAATICSLFGLECKMYDKKIEKAKTRAAQKLIAKATEAGADGIMNLNFQIHNLTIFASGTAYKNA